MFSRTAKLTLVEQLNANTKKAQDDDNAKIVEISKELETVIVDYLTTYALSNVEPQCSLKFDEVISKNDVKFKLLNDVDKSRVRSHLLNRFKEQKLSVVSGDINDATNGFVLSWKLDDPKDSGKHSDVTEVGK
jgi:hypothetical protein